MRSNEYWNRRFEAIEADVNRAAKASIASIERNIRDAQRELERDISRWYSRFADNNKIDMAEARRFLNANELAEFKWTLQEYTQFAKDNIVSGAWTRQLENASAKVHISRLETLQLQIGHASERIFGSQIENLTDLSKRQILETYNQAMFEIQRGLNIGFDVGINEQKLDALLNRPWTTDKMTFSDRIWRDKARLTAELENILTQDIMLGKTANQLIDDFAAAFNTTRNNAARLIATESSYMSALAELEVYKDLEVELYRILATLDDVTSEICQEMDGEIFPVSEFRPGVTANPFHPWCRTTTVPHFDDNFGERVAREAETGKRYYVPNDMKYGQWKETFVDKTKKHGTFELLEITASDAQTLMDSLQTLEDALDKLPDKHRDEIMNFVERIELGSTQDAYDTDNNIMFLQANTDMESVLHEIGHAFQTKNDLLNDLEFIQVMQNDMPGSLRWADLSLEEFANNQRIHIYTGRGSQKFVAQYQGRIYTESFTGFKSLNVRDLIEYFPEGFQYYFRKPDVLRTRDPMLFDFIERMLSG